jgi:signal transduction histidine kinase
MKRRLFFQFFMTILLSLLVVAIAASLIWRLAQSTNPARNAFEVAAQLASTVLPPANMAASDQQAALEKFATNLGTDLALFDANRKPIAAAGQPLPPPDVDDETGGWMHVPGGKHAWSIALPDGRWLVLRAPKKLQPRHRPGFGLVGILSSIALAVGLGAALIVRTLTGRLERLEQGVIALGSGDLSTRVDVEGRDEISTLAQSFNRSAERIEALVGAHKMLLANASHELRTPLSRIRLGIELLKQGPDLKREAALLQDIAELDELIDEILLSSRLDAISTLEIRETVDLLGLAAEECARYSDCTLEGTAVSVSGDPRLLRRMIRNLLENAARHGTPPIMVSITANSNQTELMVTDSGPGIASGDRDKVFEPFQRATNRSSSTGAGLGLTLVRQIAERHNGSAHYQAGETGGSQFRIVLPGPVF